MKKVLLIDYTSSAPVIQDALLQIGVNKAQLN